MDATIRKILLIDDDIALVKLLRDYLELYEFKVSWADCEHLEAYTASISDYDLVVLDIIMSGMSGIDILHMIRSSSDVPVMILTACGDDDSGIRALEIGADDYVTKPCNPIQLAARIRAILKRAGNARYSTDVPLIAGELTLCLGRLQCSKNGVTIELSSTEFGILKVLAQNAGRPVSKMTISQSVLGRPLCRFDRTIDMHISRIRQKLGPLADGQSYIKTVVRQGYQLITEPRFK